MKTGMSLMPATSRRAGRVGLLLFYCQPHQRRCHHHPQDGWQVTRPCAWWAAAGTAGDGAWGSALPQGIWKELSLRFITAPLLSWFPVAWGATLNVNVKSGLKKLPNSDSASYKTRSGFL